MKMFAQAEQFPSERGNCDRSTLPDLLNDHEEAPPEQ